MKKLGILTITLLVTFCASAQITLNYNTHCYKENQNYTYNIVEYAPAGTDGENCIWDFSGLALLEVMDGEISTKSNQYKLDQFPENSVAITENGNTFIYQSTQSEMKQLGYVSPSGLPLVQYTKPMVKLRFPFSFTDSYEGDVELNYPNSNYVKKGIYTVSADAYGTVILPNGKVCNNSLRVHSLVKYDLGGGNKQVQDIYRWYTKNASFPVMVVQDLQHLQSSGKITHNYKAAYNNAAIQLSNNEVSYTLGLSPNPAVSQVTLSMNVENAGWVKIDLYSLEGKFVQQLFKAEHMAGNQTFSLYPDRSVLEAGVYLIKVSNGDKVYTQRLILQD